MVSVSKAGCFHLEGSNENVGSTDGADFGRTRAACAHRSAYAHQPARAPPRRRWRTFWAITTTPSWRIPPGLPKAPNRRTGAGSQGKSRQARRQAGRARTTPSRSVGCWKCAARSSTSTATRITADNWESLYDAAAAKMAQPDWEDQVLKTSGLEQVFLTNDFDDPLEGFDTQPLHPLPADRRSGVSSDAKPQTRQRLAKATGIEVSSDAASFEGRSANCSSISQATGAGLRDFAAARFSPREPVADSRQPMR